MLSKKDAFSTRPREAAPSGETEPAMLPLREYRQLVDRCAANRIDQEIDNGSPVHARVLISKLFEVAREEVLLVSGALTDTTPGGVEIYAYREVIEQAKRFLREPNAKLTIIVLSGSIDRDAKNRFLTEVSTAEDRLGMITIHLPKEGLVGKHAPHFMVVDQSAYRYETGSDSIQEKGATVRTAIANFGDTNGASELAKLFRDAEEKLVSENILRETKRIKALAMSI